MKASHLARHAYLFFPCLLVLSLTLTGCSSKSKSPVLSGKVLYHDKPVTGGTIKLISEKPGADGKIAEFPGAISPTGEYVVSGAPAGEMKVVIETESIKRQSQGPQMMGNVPPEMLEKMKKAKEGVPESSNRPQYVEIPHKYSDPNQTDLKVTLTGGSQKQDFKLAD